jgi:hypothetical protein
MVSYRYAPILCWGGRFYILFDEESGDYDRAIGMSTRVLTIYPHYADAHGELEKASESAVRQQ